MQVRRAAGRRAAHMSSSSEACSLRPLARSTHAWLGSLFSFRLSFFRPLAPSGSKCSSDTATFQGCPLGTSASPSSTACILVASAAFAHTIGSSIESQAIAFVRESRLRTTLFKLAPSRTTCATVNSKSTQALKHSDNQDSQASNQARSHAGSSRKHCSI